MIHDPQVELSLTSDGWSPQECAQEALPVGQPRGSILIIDDDRDQAFVLAKRLEKLGFATGTAHEGRDGLGRALAEEPDLVVLDLQLPDMSGLDVCREIADSPRTCGLPVIVVSGEDAPDIVRECRAAGSEFFVRKPYDPNVLLVLIEQAIGW
ncbi:MAG: response regulator [Planctomycetales bacterium]|nr:response regulator [Planctomycetales bacterium]